MASAAKLFRELAEHVATKMRAGTAVEIKRLVEKHIRPTLGKHKAAAITADDVGKLHHALKRTPRQANLVITVCSKMFALSEKWELREVGSNPCRDVERYPEKERERFLSGAELVRLGSILRMAGNEGLPWTVDEKKAKAKHLAKPENRRTLVARVNITAIKLLLYTGCRLSETLNLRWDQVDLDNGVMTLLETKAGRPRVVVLNPPARQVLKDSQKVTGSPWVLPSRTDHKLALSKAAIEGAWQRIRAATDLSDVRLHDLRHTFGTVAGQSGANSFVIRDALGHKDIAMTARYVKSNQDPVRVLSDLVGAQLAACIDGHPPAEMMLFKRGI